MLIVRFDNGVDKSSLKVAVKSVRVPEVKTCCKFGVPAFVLLIISSHVAVIVVGPVIVCYKAFVLNDVVVPVPEKLFNNI